VWSAMRWSMQWRNLRVLMEGWVRMARLDVWSLGGGVGWGGRIG
jgi:hypothetical protein